MMLNIGKLSFQLYTELYGNKRGVRGKLCSYREFSPRVSRTKLFEFHIFYNVLDKISRFFFRSFSSIIFPFFFNFLLFFLLREGALVSSTRTNYNCSARFPDRGRTCQRRRCNSEMRFSKPVRLLSLLSHLLHFFSFPFLPPRPTIFIFPSISLEVEISVFRF